MTTGTYKWIIRRDLVHISERKEKEKSAYPWCNDEQIVEFTRRRVA